MFGKFFASTFNGSMYGAGTDVFAVWGYAIANSDALGHVDLNPSMLAGTLGSTVENMKAAIQFLEAKDPDSRNPAEEGRRIIREGQYQYRIVSYSIYLGIRNDADRKAYNAQKKRESRERLKERSTLTSMTSRTVMDGQRKSAHIDVDSDVDTDQKTNPPTPLAGGLPKGKKPRRTRDPLPLNRVGGVALEAFEAAKACWPLEITGWNDRIRSNETKPISIGNLPNAQKNFLQLIEEGHATPRELYACAWVATNEWKTKGYLWVPHMSTFYGPEKETWAQYLTRAKEAIQAQDQEEVTA